MNLQKAIDTWEASLKATCGALVPEKTVWWLVSFKWTGTSWSYAGINDSPGDLYINDIFGARKVVKRLEPYQAYETLGVFLAPDGNLKAQLQKMKNVAIKWADNLRTGSLGRCEVWIALQSTILRTLNYPLPALRLTKAQCNSILAPILQYCLPEMGICRNFPRSLVFSTLDYMGLNILHLSYIREISRIKDVIFHTFNDTLTGRLYKTSMELFFIEIGTDPQHLSLDPTIIEVLATPTLIKSTMLFIAQNNIQIKHSIISHPQREFDQYIIASLIQAQAPIEESLVCNQCRLFLKACFL
jgi:hypothetical protein